MNLSEIPYEPPPDLSLLRVRAASVGNAALCEQAIRWLMPWTLSTFPGLRKGILSILPGVYTWQAVQHWRRGRRHLPAHVAEAMAEMIGARCRAGQSLEAELRAHAAAQRALPRPVTGCCRIEAAGWNRRGYWRR